MFFCHSVSILSILNQCRGPIKVGLHTELLRETLSPEVANCLPCSLISHAQSVCLSLFWTIQKAACSCSTLLYFQPITSCYSCKPAAKLVPSHMFCRENEEFIFFIFLFYFFKQPHLSVTKIWNWKQSWQPVCSHSWGQFTRSSPHSATG